MDPITIATTTPDPTTLRTFALAAHQARQQDDLERRRAAALDELPRRATEYLGGLAVTPEMIDGEELVVDGLRFRLADSGALAVLLPCPDAAGLCPFELASLADLGALLSETTGP